VLQLAIELAREIGADRKVVIVLKHLPACLSFAAPAVFAHRWKHAQLRQRSALHREAKRQTVKAGIFSDAELLAESEANTNLRCAEEFRANLIVMGMRNRTILTD